MHEEWVDEFVDDAIAVAEQVEDTPAAGQTREADPYNNWPMTGGNHSTHDPG